MRIHPNTLSCLMHSHDINVCTRISNNRLCAAISNRLTPILITFFSIKSSARRSFSFSISDGIKPTTIEFLETRDLKISRNWSVRRRQLEALKASAPAPGKTVAKESHIIIVFITAIRRRLICPLENQGPRFCKAHEHEQQEKEQKRRYATESKDWYQQKQGRRQNWPNQGLWAFDTLERDIVL